MFNSYKEEIITFVNNKFNNNSYLIFNKKHCLIIDPSFNDKEIMDFIKKNNLQPLAIILTHGHYDHFGNSENLSNELKIKIYVYFKEKSVIYNFNLKNELGFYQSLNFNNVIFFDTLFLKFGNFLLKIIFTPGHTNGSICVLFKNFLFTGDTLFFNSVGRTDLPTSDNFSLTKSLEKIKKIPNDVLVFPGHDKFGVRLLEIKKINNFL